MKKGLTLSFSAIEIFRPLKTKGILLMIFGLSLFSCGDEEAILHEEPRAKEQWLNPIFYDSDFEHELNFPHFFSDSFIRARGVIQIERSIYSGSQMLQSEEEKNIRNIPREQIIYSFDSQGQVEQIVFSDNIDDREITRNVFGYKGEIDQSGYRYVELLSYKTSFPKANEDQFSTNRNPETHGQYLWYEPPVHTAKMSYFKQKEKQEKLIVIPSWKFWGPLSVDTIAHPQEVDWIILGKVTRPHRRYKVKNVVEESNTHQYQYYRTGALKRMIRNDYPIEQHRSFLYNEQERWIGYIDSSFTEKQFLSRTVHDILYDEENKPIEIIHRKMIADKQGYTFRETLRYEFKK